MPQLFKPRANTIFRSAIIAALLLIGVLLVVIDLFPRFTFETGLFHFIPQEVPFSHEHHAGEVGIDCRFCHFVAHKSSFAGIPQTQICMKCHRVLFKEAKMLERVRSSFATGKPLLWKRVYKLPDFVYFDHSIHVAKGVQCQTCHGAVETMPFVAKANDIFMTWCLHCHWKAKDYLGREASPELIRSITDCGTCHR